MFNFVLLGENKDQSFNSNGGAPAMNENNQSDKKDKNYDWAKNAEDAAKKAEEKVNQLKEEARQELHNDRGNFNNLDDQ